jgi:hypothetical protein
LDPVTKWGYVVLGLLLITEIVLYIIQRKFSSHDRS